MTGRTRLTVGAVSIAVSGVLLGGCVEQATTPGAGGTSPSQAVTPSGRGEPKLAGTEGDGTCRAGSAEAKIAPGDGAGQATFATTIVLTNTGSAPCTLHGSSELKIFTGGTGSDLGIKQVQSDDGTPYPAITLKPGDEAAMSVEYATAPFDDVPPDCLAGGTFAHVTLPGDTQPVEAWPMNREDGLPAVCGAVTVTPWWLPG